MRTNELSLGNAQLPGSLLDPPGQLLCRTKSDCLTHMTELYTRLRIGVNYRAPRRDTLRRVLFSLVPPAQAPADPLRRPLLHSSLRSRKLSDFFLPISYF